MKIILTQNVPNLGFVGDEVAVKDGYARNFLLPRGLALPLSGKNAKIIQHRRVQLDKLREESIAGARGEAEKVAATELVLQARAGTGGRLFGSVTNRDLQAAFAAQGVEVDRKSIVLLTAVKSLGTFAATVRLHTDVKVDINFKVEASEIVASEAPSEDTATPPEGGEVAAEGAAAQPEGGEVSPEGGEVAAEGAATPPEGGEVAGDAAGSKTEPTGDAPNETPA